MTAGFALCTTLHQGMFFSAFMGVGLALVIPVGQSLIADYYAEKERGRAFGLMVAMSSLGGMLGSLYATNIGMA